MPPILASFNFTMNFTIWAAFLLLALPIVGPISLLSHWLIRRYFVASLVGPAVLILVMLAKIPSSDFTDEDTLISLGVFGLSIVTSLLIGLPFAVSRRTRQPKTPGSPLESARHSSDETKPSI